MGGPFRSLVFFAFAPSLTVGFAALKNFSKQGLTRTNVLVIIEFITELIYYINIFDLFADT